MRSDWFFPRKLALRLAAGGVSNREVAYLMLGNLLLGLIVFYGAFTWANPPWTLLSVLEFVAVVVVTLMGFTKCYFAAKGDVNDQFAKQFNCLSFGVSVRSTAIIWSVYWAVVWLFREGMLAAYRFDHLGVANNLAAIGGDFGWVWTVLAAVVWQVVFFAWLHDSLVRANRPPEPAFTLDRALAR